MITPKVFTPHSLVIFASNKHLSARIFLRKDPWETPGECVAKSSTKQFDRPDWMLDDGNASTSSSHGEGSSGFTTTRSSQAVSLVTEELVKKAKDAGVKVVHFDPPKSYRDVEKVQYVVAELRKAGITLRLP